MKGKKHYLVITAAGLLSGALYAADDPAAEMALFSEKLQSCEEYSGPFVHPLMGTTLNRTIEGMVDGNCIYKEEMPNDGLMTCEMSDETRAEFVEFYSLMASAESVSSSTSSSTTLDDDSASTTTESTTRVDDVEVSNPLEGALASGTCTISGY